MCLPEYFVEVSSAFYQRDVPQSLFCLRLLIFSGISPLPSGCWLMVYHLWLDSLSLFVEIWRCVGEGAVEFLTKLLATWCQESNWVLHQEVRSGREVSEGCGEHVGVTGWRRGVRRIAARVKGKVYEMGVRCEEWDVRGVCYEQSSAHPGFLRISETYAVYFWSSEQWNWNWTHWNIKAYCPTAIHTHVVWTWCVPLFRS